MLAYLLPSRYRESDRFNELAAEIVGDSQPGSGQVQALTEFEAIIGGR